jgi:hypothetical protein
MKRGDLVTYPHGTTRCHGVIVCEDETARWHEGIWKVWCQDERIRIFYESNLRITR